jgi:hypothetical protein
MTKEKIDKSSSIIIFDIIEKRINCLSNSSDRIDTKASTLIGFEGVVISILFSTYSLVKPAVDTFIIGIIFLFISLFLAILSIKPSYRFRIDPKPRGLYEGYIEKKAEDTLEAITVSIIDSFEVNEKINYKKAKLLNLGFSFLLFSLIFIILSVYQFDLVLNIIKEVF